MAKLTVTTFLSVDGVMQSPGGPEEDPRNGFDLGGWLVPYADEDMGRIVVDWFTDADGFLLGRNTYETFASHWPHVTDEADPIAPKLNDLPKYVATRTLDTVEWNNSTILKGDVVQEIIALKKGPGREIQVHGSGDLVQTLMAHDLVDEYRLLVYPVILGKGQRLFANGAVPAALSLIDSRTTGAGVIAQTYRRVGDLEFGSFALDQ